MEPKKERRKKTFIDSPPAKKKIFASFWLLKAGIVST